MDKVAGLVLAGGQSSRMGGRDKCLMPLAGIPLVERVSQKLSAGLPQLLINTNANPDEFSYLGFDVRGDVFEGYAGPLAGVLTGMRWAQEKPDIDWILTAAADTPFFPDNYTETMLASKKENDIVLAATNGRRHPVFGLWRVSLADRLQEFLESGDRKVMLFVQQFAHIIQDFEAGRIDPFFNLNTPEDWKTAEQMMTEHADG